MASGDTLLTVPAWSGIPPAANYAVFDTRNGHPIADFDDASDESLYFSLFMPAHYDGGGVAVDLFWSATSATSGDVKWAVSIERISDSNQDIDADGFAAANTATDTAPGTSGHVTKATVTFTDGADMDSVAAGEWFRVKITRDADDGADTLSGDVELHSFVIRES